MKEFFEKHAYPCCLNWLLCVGILTTVNQYCTLKVNEIFIIFISFVWIAMIQLIDKNKKNAIPYIVIALVLLVFFLFFITSEVSLFDEYNKFVDWLTTTLREGKSSSIWYSMLSINLLLVALSVVFHLILKRYLVKWGLAIALVAGLLIFSISQISVSKIGVCCFITYIVMMIVEIRLHVFYKKIRTKETKVMPFLMPFLMTIVVILTVLPMDQRPIEWKLIRQFITTISNSINSLFTNIDFAIHPDKVDFSLSFSGYTEDGDVGGSLESDASEALSVKTAIPIINNIYLTGNVKNTYNGSEWSYDAKEGSWLKYGNEYAYDVIELMYSVLRTYDSFEVENLYRINKIDITFDDIDTKSVFYAQKMFHINNVNMSLDMDDKTANLRFEKVRGADTTYRVSYVNLNLGSKYFDDMIKQQSQYRYSDKMDEQTEAFITQAKHNEILQNYDIPHDFEKLLYNRCAAIQQEYTQVYDELPERVRQLAIDVTKDCDTDYDKLVALEKYLSLYTYTTIPKEIPKGEDLIDYVLFTSKEGYCTYYATIFAIMARCIGIPTRYIQGFYIPTRELENTYEYFAYNRNAHAWVEAYIEGVGWMSFEPTPSYSSLRSQPWQVSQSQPQVIVTPTVVIDQTKIEEELRIQEEIRNRNIAYQSIAVIAIILLGIVLLSIPIYFILRVHHLRKQYNMFSREEKVFWNVDQILTIFCISDRDIKDGETFTNYMKAMAIVNTEFEEEIVDTEQIFIRLRYNDSEPSKEDTIRVEVFRKKLLLHTKEKLSRKKYLQLRWHLFYSKHAKKNKSHIK